jgi:hypothetical protein
MSAFAALVGAKRTSISVEDEDRTDFVRRAVASWRVARMFLRFLADDGKA